MSRDPGIRKLSYGDFYPLYTGTAPNQRVQHRGLIKGAYQHRKAPADVLGFDRRKRRLHRPVQQARIPVAVLGGFQFTF